MADHNNKHNDSEDDSFLRNAKEESEGEHVGKVRLEYSSSGFGKVDKEVKELGKHFKELRKEIEEGVKEAFNDIVSSVGKVVLGFVSIKKSLSSTYETILEVNKEWTNLSVRFGSMKGGEQALHFVNELSKKIPVAREEIISTVSSLKSLNFQLKEIEGLPLEDLGTYAAVTGKSMSSLVKQVEDLTRFPQDLSKAYEIAQELAESGLLRPGETVQTVVNDMMRGISKIKGKPGEMIFGSKAAFEEILRSLNKYYARTREMANSSIELTLQRLKNSLTTLQEAVLGKFDDVNSPMHKLLTMINDFIDELNDKSSTLHHFFEDIGKVFKLFITGIGPYIKVVSYGVVGLVLLVGRLADLIQILEDAGLPVVELLGGILGIITASKGLKILTEGFIGLGQWIRLTSLDAKDLYSSLKNVVSVIGSKASSLWEGLSSIFKSKKGVEDLGSFVPAGKTPFARPSGKTPLGLPPGPVLPAVISKAGLPHVTPEAGLPTEIPSIASKTPGTESSPYEEIIESPSSEKKVGIIEKINSISGRNLLQIAGSLVAVAGALWIFAKALQEFSNVESPLKSLGLAIASLGLLGAALYGFMAIMSTFSLALPVMLGGLLALVVISASILALAFAFQLFAGAMNDLADALIKLADVSLVELGFGFQALGVGLSSFVVMVANPLTLLGLEMLSGVLPDISNSLEKMSLSAEGVVKLPPALTELSKVDLSKVASSLSGIEFPKGAGGGVGGPTYNLYVSGYIQSIDELKKQLDRLDNKKRLR
jgi:polyhydroxyalkanoate synthesis regulator phasin/archaellum component FlaC